MRLVVEPTLEHPEREKEWSVRDVKAPSIGG
jgi:hypothetical protein